MYSKVKRLRQRGARLSDREIQSDSGTVGHLTLVTVGAIKEMKLHGAGDDARANAIIPILYDATLISMHGARMLLRGFECHGPDSGSPTYMQEWSVEVMVEPPAEAQVSHRPPS